MSRWQILATCIAVLAVAGQAPAQSYALVEPPLPDSHYRIQLSMSLHGELKIQQEGKTVGLKTTVSATHDYLERLLEAGTVTRSARVYQNASVAMTVDQDKLQRQLRPEHTFIVAQRSADQTFVYCPRGPLTREELDVTDHFNTLAVTGLLPGKDLPVGSTWKVSNATVQALCHLQGLTEHTLTGKLDQVKDDGAVFTITGTANGIDEGASVKATVQALCRFDLKQRRLTEVLWEQTDEREAGPISPASSIKVVTKMQRTPVAAPNELSDIALLTWPVPKGEPARAMTNLAFKDGKGRFELLYGRDWNLVSHTDDHVVLRLMNHGEFVAQAVVAPWKKAEAGKHMPEDEFKALVATAPGWEQDKMLRPGEVVPLFSDHWGYLVAAEGDLDNVRVVQYFYLVAGPDGGQAIVTFTMTPGQVQKLGSQDLELVRGMSMAK